jgi:hypothetical protein
MTQVHAISAASHLPPNRLTSPPRHPARVKPDLVRNNEPDRGEDFSLLLSQQTAEPPLEPAEPPTEEPPEPPIDLKPRKSRKALQRQTGRLTLSQPGNKGTTDV